MRLAASIVSGLVSSASIAHGLNLRGVEIGDPCTRAIDRERELHSQAMLSVEEMTRSERLGFNDLSTPDEPRKILYGCDSGGHVSSYSISTVVHDEGRARQLYAKVKADLRHRFGTPDIDSDGFNAAQKLLLKRTYQTDAAQRKNVSGTDLNISLGAPVGGGWSVDVHVKNHQPPPINN